MSATALVAISAFLPVAASAQIAPGAADTIARPNNPATADDAGTANDIIVTGSRIPQHNLESGQPTIVLDSKSLTERGFTNIADALNELPSFGVPGSSPVGAQSGGSVSSGQNFANLFGLGSQRTLTIVNGRRVVSSNTASIFGPAGAGSQVDLNVIPNILVDRVETIAVGGAPIYGSDAIAGTINIITKEKFTGFQAEGQYEMSERGDGPTARLGALAGLNFGGGRGNLMIAGEYTREDGLTNDDRPGSRLNSFFTTPLDPSSPFQNAYIADRRIPALSQYGVPLVTDFIPLSPGQADSFGFQPSVTNAVGQPLAFDPHGNLVPIDFGKQTGNLINFNGGNGYVLPGNLRASVRRYVGAALGQYEVTDDIRVFGEAWYANSRGVNLRAEPVYNSALFDAGGTPDGNLVLSIDNPYLSPSARQTILASLTSNPAADSTDIFYLGRANTDLYSGRATSTVELYRFVGGVDGKFRTLGRDMRFELVGNYGRSTTQGREQALVQQNFENALNAVKDASGNITCAQGYTNAPIATFSNTCSPINPFGQQISKAALDYVTTEANPRAVNEQWIVTASVSGSLFKLWGGDIAFALGYEHREERASFDPGQFYYGQPDPTDPTKRTQLGRSLPIDPVKGKFSTNEFFGEMTVPLIGPDQHIPLVRSLNLHGAARTIDNSLAGNDWTYTGDVRWEVFPGISLRTNYTRSVRAPAITELFNPTSQITTTAADPCDSRFLSSGPNPGTRGKNCAAAGLPADFQSNIVDFTAKGTLQGNSSLQNEISDANVFGAILQPKFLPGFSASVDWVNIRVRGAIASLDATQVLEACYDSGNYPNNLCSQFTRDASGQVTFIQTGYANAASEAFRGLVMQAAYTIQTPFLGPESSVTVHGQYQYMDKLTLRIGEGAVTTLRDSLGYSSNKATVDASYSNGPFNWSLRWRYLGPTLNDPDAAPNTYEFSRVPGVSFFDTTFGVKVNKQFNLRFIVNNLFDKAVPFPAPANGGVATYFQGVYGRSFQAGASIGF